MQFGDISDNEIKGFCVYSQFRMMEIITINILAHQHKPVSVNIKCMCQAVGFLWHTTRWNVGARVWMQQVPKHDHFSGTQ